MSTWAELKDRVAAELADPEQWVWVPDRSWRVPARVSDCKIQCGVPPVAERDRYRALGSRRGPRWYGLCLDHLAPYYRLSDDGATVETAVRLDSPAAQRGWTE